MKLLSLSLSLDKLKQRFNRSNFLVLSALIIFVVFELLITTNFAVINGYEEKDNILFVNFASSMNEGKMFYKDIFDVKGPLFFWLISIFQIIPFSGIGLYILINIFWVLFAVFSFKFIRIFLGSRKTSWFATIAFMLLFFKDLHSFARAEEMFTLPILMVYFYCFLKIVRRNFQIKYFAVTGICISCILFIKHFNLLLPIITFLIFCVVLAIYEKEQLFSILKRVPITLCAICLTSFIIIIPNLLQGTFMNMIAQYFEFPFTVSKFSFNFVSRFIYSFGVTNKSMTLILVLGLSSVLLISIPKIFKSSLVFSGLLLYILSFNFSTPSMENKSCQFIFFLFGIFIPIGLCSFIKKTSSDFNFNNTLLCLLVGMLCFIQIDTHYIPITKSFIYKHTKFTKTHILDKVSNEFSVYSISRISKNEFCNRYKNMYIDYPFVTTSPKTWNLQNVDRWIPYYIMNQCKVSLGDGNLYRYDKFVKLKLATTKDKEFINSKIKNYPNFISKHQYILKFEKVYKNKDSILEASKALSRSIYNLTKTKYKLKEVQILGEMGFFFFQKGL